VDGETARIMRDMIIHLALISEPDGTIPMLGDSDGGRLLDLGGGKNDIRGACCTAALLLEDQELKYFCRDRLQEETIWLLGAKALEMFDNLKARAPSSCHSLNRETGFFCFRHGIGKNNPYILSVCGPHGWRACGHAHSHLLSYNLYNEGMMVLTDPGTVTYPSMDGRRNLCRSSMAHNTISVNGVSQSIPSGAFRWKRIAHPECVFSDAFDGFGYLEGGHRAYGEYGCTHTRAIMCFREDLAAIVDMLGIDGTLDHVLYNLQFNEGRLEHRGGNVYSFNGKDDRGYTEFRFFSTAPFSIDNGVGAIYPDYNEEVSAPRFRLTASDVTGDHVIVTLLGLRGNSVEEFEFDGSSRVTGKLSSARCSITLEDTVGETGEGGNTFAGLSVFYGGAKNALFMLRDSCMASSPDGELRFETRDRQKYCTALLKGKTLRIRMEKPRAAFRLTSDIDKLYINGTPIDPVSRGDWITIEQ